MESLLNKCNSMHRRSGSNKENQAPIGCNLRLFKNHSSGPIGIPFKPKNSNNVNFHNGLNLLRNQANQFDHHKLTVNNGFNLNTGLNNGFNRKSNLNINNYQATKLIDENMNHLNILTSSINSSRSNISKVQSYQQQMNQQPQVNQLSLSTSTNSSSSQNKLSDLYKSQYSGSSSSLLSYGSSNDNSTTDKRFLPPPPKQNIMYHEQRYKTELCRAYEEQKNCVYGDRCMFAHGQWELKQSVTKHPKYKTQKCSAFEEGLCMFGTRCSFLHEKIGSAEEIVDSMLQLNQLNKEKFSIPSQPTIKKSVTNLDTIDEQTDFLSKAIDDIEKRAEFLSSLKNESLFDFSTATLKPEFNFHPKSFNNALGNIIRLDNINEQTDKSKLLPDLTSLLVDDHANSNTLFFNDDSTSCSSRLPIFEKITISSTNSPLQLSTNESIPSNDKMDIMDNLDSSNNSSKSNCTTKSSGTVSSIGANSMSCESTISINSSDLKLMDFDIDSFI